jgi:DNA-binding MarR family transcriptional regulator
VEAEAARSGSWTFLTNHARVLACIARQPDVLLREVAASVGITERAVQAIVADLEASGYLERARVGRRNRYQVDPSSRLRHPLNAHVEVRELLDLLDALPERDRDA